MRSRGATKDRTPSSVPGASHPRIAAARACNSAPPACSRRARRSRRLRHGQSGKADREGYMRRCIARNIGGGGLPIALLANPADEARSEVERSLGRFEGWDPCASRTQHPDNASGAQTRPASPRLAASPQSCVRSRSIAEGDLLGGRRSGIRLSATRRRRLALWLSAGEEAARAYVDVGKRAAAPCATTAGAAARAMADVCLARDGGAALP
jgi:hypothetical protein